MPSAKLDDPPKPEATLTEKPKDFQAPKVTPIPPKALPVNRHTRPDSLILRLDRLFAPAKDLGSVLSTFNYSLYFLAYLDAKLKVFRKTHFAPAAQDVTVTISKVSDSTQAELSPFARLGSVVNNARMTLRLFALLPIYVKMRKVMQGPIGGMDSLLHTISVIQCALYAVFQLLENVAFLTENGVLSKRLTDSLTKKTGHVAAIYKLAHRAWFLSVVCDFVRLFRIGQLVVSGSSAQAKGTDDKAQANGIISGEPRGALHPQESTGWYPKWVRPLAWLPIAWQLSAWSEEDVPGLHMGVRGIAGILADLGTTMTLWEATADVQG